MTDNYPHKRVRGVHSERHGQYVLGNVRRLGAIAGFLETVSTATNLAAVKAAAAACLRELNENFHLDHDLWFANLEGRYSENRSMTSEIPSQMDTAREFFPDLDEVRFRKLVEDLAWNVTAHNSVTNAGEHIYHKSYMRRVLDGTAATNVGGVSVCKLIDGRRVPPCRIQWGPPDKNHADHFDTGAENDERVDFIPWKWLPTAKVTSKAADNILFISANIVPVGKDVFWYYFGGGEGRMPQKWPIASWSR